MAILTYKGNKFFLDGDEYTIISGAMHYFRENTGMIAF